MIIFNQQGDDCVPDVADDSEYEEQEGHQKGQQDADDDNLHREVSLGAQDFSVSTAFLALYFFSRQTYGTLDDAGRLDDADDAGSGDTADADVPCVGSEYGLGGH